MTRSSTRPWDARLQPIERLLACAALREDLGSLLLYDATPALLEQVAEAWRWMRAAVLGQPLRSIREVYLGPWTTEEDLWGRGGALPAPWGRPGLLADEAPRLVVIHDVTRLSLAGQRACVTLMGAEIGVLQREGQSRSFQPHCYWLAACALSSVGQVSPHLLDRFALRVRAPVLEVDRLKVLLDALEGKRSPREARRPSGTEARRLADASRVLTRLTAEAGAEAVARLPHAPGAGHRGLLTLVRMASALASLEPVEHGRGSRSLEVEVRADEVREAARLLQLPEPKDDGARRLSEELPPERTGTGQPEAREHAEAAGSSKAPVPAPAPVVSPEEDAPLTVETRPAVVSPVAPQPGAGLSPLELERTAPVQRDHAPLRLPFFRAGGMGITGRGVVLGTRPATDLRDVSLLHTLLAAVPYQPQRRKHAEGAARKGLLLTRSDLRSYRRAPVPQHLLVLVLDFTCLDTADWQGALRRYLAEAYVERARVCVIQVGVQGTAREELRAKRVVARSLLVPAVAQALDATPGRATPLADGLDLAAATLRRMLHVGRAAAHHAWLVVFTDGRGNIPLEASRTGHLSGPVGREGVDDALHVAERLRGMRQVTPVVLKPPLTALAELPVRLADALGAELVEVAPPVGPPEGGPS